MVAPERFVRRAQQHLEPDEGVLGSFAGREADGRRRVGVVATDHRVLLLTLRPEPPIVLDYDGLEVDLHTTVTARVTFECGLASYGVDRVAEVEAARLVVGLIRQRINDGSVDQERAPAFRIVS